MTSTNTIFTLRDICPLVCKRIFGEAESADNPAQVFDPAI